MVPVSFGRQFPCRVPLSALAIALLLAPARAQLHPEGLSAGTQALAPTASLALVSAAGRVDFDGTTLSLLAPGQSPQLLLQLPNPVFGSFLVQTDAAHVLFGYTASTPALWLVPLQGPPPIQPLATLAFNYDADRFDATHALVSARTGGFTAPNNELWLLDLTNGATQLVAEIPGASGPVAIAANGDVYTATGYAGFPTPPGSASVLRFPRPLVDAAIAAHRVLQMQHAQLVLGGLDAVADMAFDDDGDLLFTDWFNSRVSEISDAATFPNLVPSVVDYATASVFPTTVQFVAGTGSGVFEPFQPPNGTLYVLETDYLTTSQLRTLRAAPAPLATNAPSPVPAGPFALTVSNGPIGGLGVVAFAAGTTPGTLVVQVSGFEAPLAWSAALWPAPPLAVLPFDAAGNATLTVTNPGFASGLWATAQVAFVSAAGGIGATAPLAVLLGP